MIRRTIATVAAILTVALVPAVTLAEPAGPREGPSAPQAAFCACEPSHATAVPEGGAAARIPTSTTSPEELDRIWTSP
jgi:hypothetical protein